MSNNLSPEIKIPPAFKLVLLIVTGFTFLCLVLLAYLSFMSSAKTMEDVPVLQQNLYDICRFGWQSGFGAIIGLIGGNLTTQ